MIGMLSIPHQEFQKVVYKMLQTLVLKRSRDDSVALDLKLYDNGREVAISFPILEAINAKQRKFSFDYCLLWMLVFDHFNEAVPFTN